MGAIKELDNFYVHSELARRGIEWIVNPPSASNFGGSWEVMIKLVRKVLTHTIHRQVLTDESLRTIFCEAEYVVNSRPLTVPSSDAKDAKPLTPNQVLHLKEAEPEIMPFDDADSYSKRRWKQNQVLAQSFWRRWSQEYVKDLQHRQKWPETSQNLKTDDVVLVVDPASPRPHWPIARVVDVKHSSDGLIRSATVKSAYWTLVRPVNKIVKLFSPG